jgi:hypothetical protein
VTASKSTGCNATTDDPQTAADHTASAAERPLGGRYRHCTKPTVDSDLSKATSRRSSMILRADTWRCSRLGVQSRKTWMSAARTPSDQGLRRRMIDHFNEPRHREPRGGRSLPFAVSKERPTGSWAALCPSKKSRKADHKATAATAADTNCAQHQPFDRTGHRSTALLNYFVARGIFAFCLCACATSLERRKREKPARGKSLLLLCVVRAHSSA